MLEIGLAHRPRREQTNLRIVLVAQRQEFSLERLKERSDAFDTRGAINVRDGARQREPVFDGVAGARGRLRTIAEHPPAAVGAAADVDGVEAQVRAAGRRYADHRTQEFRIAGDQRGGQTAVAG